MNDFWIVLFNLTFRHVVTSYQSVLNFILSFIFTLIFLKYYGNTSI